MRLPKEHIALVGELGIFKPNYVGVIFRWQCYVKGKSIVYAQHHLAFCAKEKSLLINVANIIKVEYVACADGQCSSGRQLPSAAATICAMSKFLPTARESYLAKMSWLPFSRRV